MRFRRLAALSLAFLFSVGCSSYCPVRWPRRELWAASVESAPPITMPSSNLSAYPDHLEREHVAVAVEFMDPSRANNLLHVDAATHGIQPLMIVIRNGSDQPYQFSQAGVGARIVPAARVASLAGPRPVATVLRHLKWLAFLVPGFLFDTVVEPATTFEFPGMQDASQRPARFNRQQVSADVVAHEIADAVIAPGSSHAGLLFIRRPAPDGQLSITLTNTQTRQPLVFDVPIPPPMHVERHDYPHPYPMVWDAALRAAARVPGWRITSTDEAQGAILVSVSRGILWRTTGAPIHITLQRVSGVQTRAVIESRLQRPDHTGRGEHIRTIGGFLSRLAALLPEPTMLIAPGAALSSGRAALPRASEPAPYDNSGSAPMPK